MGAGKMDAVVQIDCKNILNWDSFHTIFAAALGFPDYYGRNMNAWIDCVYELDPVTIVLNEVDRLPAELLSAVVDCAAFVNWREVAAGRRPIVSLAYHRKLPG